jgi:hypothetical protein
MEKVNESVRRSIDSEIAAEVLICGLRNETQQPALWDKVWHAYQNVIVDSPCQDLENLPLDAIRLKFKELDKTREAEDVARDYNISMVTPYACLVIDEEVIDSIVNNLPLPGDNHCIPLAEGWVKVVDVDWKVENSEKYENR